MVKVRGMEIEARPWAGIVAHYCRLEDGQPYEGMLPLHGLVEKLASSPYAKGLVAYTSVWDLVIAQSEANFWSGPELRISYEPWNRRFLFTFRQREDDGDPWTRTAGPDEGFEVLERFLVKRARWFRKPDQSEPESPSPSSA